LAHCRAVKNAVEIMPMTESEPIRGLWCASLTPFQKDHRVDHARFATHVHGLLARGVDGVVPFGTTGEGASCSVAERAQGLEALLAAGIPPDALAVATGCAAFPDTLALTRHALESGCPRCLVLPPFFWKELSEEAVFRWYAALIEAVGDPRLRLYLYHLPQISDVPIGTEVAARLVAAYPGIVAGVKDSGGDFGHTEELLARLPGLAILVGHEPHLPRLMRSGGAGTICGVANLFPELVAALLRPEVAREDEQRLRSFLDVVFRYPLLPAFKAIRAALEGDSVWSVPRLPLLPLAEGQGRELLAALREAGFLSSSEP
jgi:4-hydroxy-tetrahydrodipicolinate synthase